MKAALLICMVALAGCTTSPSENQGPCDAGLRTWNAIIPGAWDLASNGTDWQRRAPTAGEPMPVAIDIRGEALIQEIHWRPDGGSLQDWDGHNWANGRLAGPTVFTIARLPSAGWTIEAIYNEVANRTADHHVRLFMEEVLSASQADLDRLASDFVASRSRALVDDRLQNATQFRVLADDADIRVPARWLDDQPGWTTDMDTAYSLAPAWRLTLWIETFGLQETRDTNPLSLTVNGQDQVTLGYVGARSESAKGALATASAYAAERQLDGEWVEAGPIQLNQGCDE